MPSSPTVSSVGRRLRQARERLGLTQADLANLLGKTATAISYWEGGQRSPGLDDLIDLASVLQLNPADLLPAQSPRVVARAEAASLAVADLADAVDRILDHYEGHSYETAVPAAPTSNPAEAAGFARRKAQQRTAPIDIRKVLHECGCEYTVEDLPDSLQGFVVVAGSTPIIAVNQGDGEPRRRFTAAHELGHVLLGHHDTFHVDLNLNEGAPPNYNWRHERAANDFAASLLMPEELVRAETETNVKPTVTKLAKRFNVSHQAMAIRLASLGIHI